MKKEKNPEELSFDFDSVYSDLRETDFDIFFDFSQGGSGLDMETSVGDEFLINYLKNIFSVLEL
jgi:hypothetical protein